MAGHCFELSEKDYEEAESFYDELSEKDYEFYDFEDIQPSTQEEVETSLKVKNSDGRNQCAACGGQIKEPYPGIRYCPVCER
jgi:hypothetical protein